MEYLAKINRMEPCELIETKEAKGLPEKCGKKIKDIGADGLEKQFKDEYIICLFDRGKDMSSEEFARFLEDTDSSGSRNKTFVVGGFLGLADRILKRSNLLLSFSRMTFSHELTRVILLEQIFRALTINKGRLYAK